MCDEWMPVVRVPMGIETFHQLPINAAYKYEYFGGAAVLSPRPRTYHAAYDLTRVIPSDQQASPEEYEVGPLTANLNDALAVLFAGAFCRTQPFAGLEDAARKDAAGVCLQRTFNGQDGPWVADASFVLRRREDQHLVGAILITLLPEGDASDIACYEWRTPPPSDLWEAGRGQPHLTWIFSHLWHKGEGIGTHLLAASAERLRRQGYVRLLSTFIAGNDSSQLWHWRNGFELLPSYLSRRMRLKA